MADIMTAEQRSRCMSRIRSTDTTPEREVRRALTDMGYRYRLHARFLPGRPDIVISRLKLAIFVHGCFWHRHRCKLGRPVPKMNADFWRAKFTANRLRDRRSRTAIRKLGWKPVIMWECSTRNPAKLKEKLSRIIYNAG